MGLCLLSGEAYAEDLSTNESHKVEQKKTDGKSLYLQQCSDCHGADGMGRSDAPKVYHCFRCEDKRELSAYISARMPPGRRHDCIGECAEKVSDYILSSINAQPKPARIAKKLTVRRLNKRQYNNTVRDLLGLDLKLADKFPEDDFGNGFDRMGDVLSLSPLQLELYVNSASSIAQTFIEDVKNSDKSSNLAKAFISCSVKKEKACIEKSLKKLASKAWRRPIKSGEFNDLKDLYHHMQSLEAVDTYSALESVVQAILSSPNFIFQIEQEAQSQNQYLSQYEIASRLSYFLWDSMPDDTLFKLAEENRLRDEPVLVEQVSRMLKNDKSQALLDGFFGQWLLFNALGTHYVDTSEFSQYSPSVKASMLKETQLLLMDYVRSDKPFKHILNSQYTYANDVMADYYGFTGDFDKTFQKVALADYPERFGLLSQGSLLTVTSHPHRTSIVKRGKWVMANFLCEDPPPPPPGVEGLDKTKIDENATLREKMKIHSSEPSCKSCHVTMDAIGFAMETYDAVGLHRTTDNGALIDSRGEFKNGKKFANAHELSAVLADDKRLDACIVEKFYIYALSSGLTPNDRFFLDEIVEKWQDSNQSLVSLAQTLVGSDAFLRHSPERVSRP
jgi:cytochrome c553